MISPLRRWPKGACGSGASRHLRRQANTLPQQVPLAPGVKIHVTVGGFDPLDVTDRHDRSGISTSNPGIAVAAQGEALPAAIFYSGGDLLNAH
jgi:hypothetical protein